MTDLLFVGMTNGGTYPSAPPPNRPGFGEPSTTAPAPAMGNTGGGVLSQRATIPISALSPYQGKWTIRVRVASKPSIRTWSNSKGEGRVFNVDLVDESVSVLGASWSATLYLASVCACVIGRDQGLGFPPSGRQDAWNFPDGQGW